MTNVTLILPRFSKGMYGFPAPPMSVLYLASITPSGFDVKIVDERVETLKYCKTDLVGINVKTCTSKRAYQIGDKFRKLGVKVVLGGPHVSALPSEALKHADCVVIGEAESVWKNVLSDFKKGKLKQKYYGKNVSGFSSVNFKYVNMKKYLLKNVVQTSRGCPMGCDFCTPTNFNGRKIRHRPIKDVIKDIKAMNVKDILYICDDNLVGDVVYAKKLFIALKPLKIKWAAQANLNIANYELLDLAYSSGCRMLWLGFETVNQFGLDEVGKGYSADKYKKIIKKIKNKGIIILGSFVFGLDNDKKDIFSKTLNFCFNNNIDFVNFLPLVPRPGTPLFDKMLKQRRLLHKDWEMYEGFNVVYKPKTMSTKFLQRKIIEINKKFYSNFNIIKRTLIYLGKHSLKSAILLFVMNIGYKKSIKQKIRLIR